MIRNVIIATFNEVVKYIDQGGGKPRPYPVRLRQSPRRRVGVRLAPALVATPGYFAAVISTALVPVAATKAAVQAA